MSKKYELNKHIKYQIKENTANREYNEMLRVLEEVQQACEVAYWLIGLLAASAAVSAAFPGWRAAGLCNISLTHSII